MRHVRIDPATGPTEEPSWINGMCVHDRMSRPAITVPASARLGEAMRMMAANEIHYLPVVDDHATLVGIVNTDDVLGTRRRMGPQVDAVAAIMSRPVVTVGPMVPLNEATRLMADRGIGALPVVEDGHVIGILTQSDILACFAQAMLGRRQRTEPD